MKLLVVITMSLLFSPVFADCDYSEADVNNGFGFDADTGASCQPLESEALPNVCDYSEAAQNGGYGYNHSTGQSCAPLQLPVGLPEFYTTTESLDTEFASDPTFLRIQKSFCEIGDAATGGGCTTRPPEPLSPVNDHGWRIIANSPTQDNGWNCTWMCVGHKNADGTHNATACTDTELFSRVRCMTMPTETASEAVNED